MSLLMDALKKAEQAKRLAGEQGGRENAEPPAPALTLTPLAEETKSQGNAEALARTLASPALSIPDSDFLGEGSLPPRPPPAAPKLDSGGETARGNNAPPRAAANAAPKVTESEAIRNVFAVKEAAPRRNGARGWAIALAALAILVLAGIGGYVWWQMQPSGLAALPGAPSAPPTVTAPPPMPPPTASATTVAPAAVRAEPEPASSPGAPRPVSPAPSFREPRAAAPAAEGADESPLLRRTREPPRVSPQLQAAYDALARGDLGSARGNYERAWQADPHNSDALHGLASIALREEQLERAEHWFQLALRANPRDALALTGLAELAGRANPAAAEVRLRALAADFPEQAAARIALGNLYGRQARWAEAQEAYFAAYTLQPANADVLFNLAVSLEHLNQPRLAQRYYGEALKAHQRNPGRFDPARIEERLRELGTP